MGWLSEERARIKADREAEAAAKAAENGEKPPAPGLSATETGETNVVDLDHYRDAGVRQQLEILTAARAGTERTRNTTLYVSAKCLAQLGVDRVWLRRALLKACRAVAEGGNGLIDDDGADACRKTIKSGYRKADEEGPREVEVGCFDNINVEEVPMSAFDLHLDDDAPDGSASASTSATTTAPQSNGSTPIATVTPIGSASSAGKNQPPPTTKQMLDARRRIFELEADFWDRDSLSHIFDAALMRMTPPWGVLAHCVARVLILVGPAVQLPALIGGKGSLNWFGIVAAPSGDGKSSSGAVAGDLVAGSQYDALIRNIGSGEGIAAQFRPPGRNPQDHNELMFLCEEIDTLAAMKDRTSSTTTAVLCNAFMGDPLGHSYRNNATQRVLNRHDYRLTLIVGAQPGRAGTLLDDFYSGMLQRFQWFPGFDPRITRAKADPGRLVYPLTVPSAGFWTPVNRNLTVPAVVEEEVLAARERSAQGYADALDGHLLFVREKFAQGLAILDNRSVMTAEDWRLAGIATDVSQATREWVTLECKAAEDDIARRKGRPMGLARSAADVAKAEGDERVRNQCANRIYSRLKKGPATRRQLQQTTAMPKRVFDPAIDKLIAEKLIEPVITPDGKAGFALV